MNADFQKCQNCGFQFLKQTFTNNYISATYKGMRQIYNFTTYWTKPLSAILASLLS